jgi:signal peptidase I
MEKTILKGDQIVADMRYYLARLPSRGEVIIFEKKGTFFVKRVIAIGGDTIQGRSETVLINGQTIDEPYVQHTSRWPSSWAVDFGPINVPNGKYFVMGDNRDVSLDSRSVEFGVVDKSLVAGKPLYVLGSDRTGKALR